MRASSRVAEGGPWRDRAPTVAFCPYRRAEKRVLIDCYGINLRARSRPPSRRPGSERAASGSPIRRRAGRLCQAGALSRARIHLALLLLRSPTRPLEVIRLQAI